MAVELSGETMEAHIRAYFEACNSGDPDRIAPYFEPDAVHYFPPGMYNGPFRGADDRRAMAGHGRENRLVLDDRSDDLPSGLPPGGDRMDPFQTQAGNDTARRRMVRVQRARPDCR